MAERQHRVVPLAIFQKDRELSVRTVDAADQSLVVLSNDFSAQVLGRFAAILLDDLFERLGDRLDIAHISRVVRLAFTRETASEQAVRDAMDLVVELLGALRAAASEEERNLAARLFQTLFVRENAIIPFVLLPKGIGASEFATVEQDVPSLSKDRILRDRGIRRAMRDLVRIPQRMLGALGIGRVFVEIPISTLHAPERYFVRIRAAKGVRLGEDLRAMNFEKQQFHQALEKSQTTNFTSNEVVFSLTADDLSRFEVQARSGRLRDRLWLTLNVEEPIGLRLLFLLAVLLSATYTFSAGNQLGYLTAAVTSIVAIVANSLERPFSNEVLPARVALIFFILVPKILLALGCGFLGKLWLWPMSVSGCI